MGISKRTLETLIDLVEIKRSCLDPAPSGNHISYAAINAACLTLEVKPRRKRWQMVLSAERKISLEDRYEVWGLDEVRKELERPDRDQFINPDVTAFAQAWVEAKEASIHCRKRRSKIILTIVGLVLLGLAIALIPEF